MNVVAPNAERLFSHNTSTINNDHSAAASTPEYDSPTTPVSNLENDTVKIAQVSDVVGDHHHHTTTTLAAPVVTESVKMEVASHIPEVGTPLDPGEPHSIPVHPPHGTPPPPPGQLLPDVQMAESSTEVGSQADDMHEDATMKTETAASPTMSHINGHANGDVNMNASMATLPGASPNSNMRRSSDVMDDEPPAKRARKMSDDESSAPAMFAEPSGSNYPAPPTPAIDGPPFTIQQWKFCASVLKNTKKLKDATPFLHPVDPIALNIPHYPTIIKHPMDLGTVDRKLQAGNPQKPETNPEIPLYTTPGQFIADVRRVFSNCLAFNGPDHLVTQMGKRVEAAFDKSMERLPTSVIPEPVKKISPPPTVKKSGGPPARRQSMATTPIKREERPKREVHAPPPRDLGYSEPSKRTRKPRAAQDETTAEQLRFCSKVLIELNKKQHYNYASPFYEPVDYIKLGIPDYPSIVKRPMDLTTMRKRLDDHTYTNAQQFRKDFDLMMRNCYAYNAKGTPVHDAGQELERVFNAKWRELPREASDEDDDDEDDVPSDDERTRQIREMESQMKALQQNINTLKSAPAPAPKKEKKKKAPKPAAPAPVASSSKSKPAKSSSGSFKSGKKGKKLGDDEVLTFDQKKALSDAIGALDGTKLERVIQIIHEGVPEIRDSTEEIELEIDSLPSAVLIKLHNFVLKPVRSSGQAKRHRPSKGGGTGGIKRKSMDEDVEAEKIRQLEERMRLFDPESAGGQPPSTAHQSDSESDSNSDESDSDSD